MSAPLRLDPEDLDLTEVRRDGTTFYNVIPKIGPPLPGDIIPSLMKSGGRPGITYLLCPLSYKRKARQDKEWQWSPIEGLDTYTIIGPSGEIDVELMGADEPIPGSDQTSNLREMLIHEDIPRITGLNRDVGFHLPDLEETTETAPEPEPKPKARPTLEDVEAMIAAMSVEDREKLPGLVTSTETLPDPFGAPDIPDIPAVMQEVIDAEAAEPEPEPTPSSDESSQLDPDPLSS